MARVLVLADHFLPGHRAGGPIRSLARLVEVQARDHDVWVVTRDHDLGSSESFGGLDDGWNSMLGAHILYIDTHSAGGLWAARREMRRVRPDLVYMNSLFSPLFTLLPLLLPSIAGGRVPLLLAPRGQCGPAALAFKSRKKRIVSIGLRRLLNRRRVVWHGMSEAEVQDISYWWGAALEQVVVSSDIGVSANEQPSSPPSQSALRIVTVSRIVPSKDVRRLIRILGQLTVPVEGRLYGPAEDTRYWGLCRERIGSLPDNVDFSYEGDVEPDAVMDIFANADVFLFPTKGESFGHVIAESLSVGCPVLTTPTTFWTDILESGGGGVFHSDEQAVAWLELLGAQAPSERAASRKRAWALYRDWRKDSASAQSLFADAVALVGGASPSSRA